MGEPAAATHRRTHAKGTRNHCLPGCTAGAVPCHARARRQAHLQQPLLLLPPVRHGASRGVCECAGDLGCTLARVQLAQQLPNGVHVRFWGQLAVRADLRTGGRGAGVKRGVGARVRDLTKETSVRRASSRGDCRSYDKGEGVPTWGASLEGAPLPSESPAAACCVAQRTMESQA